MVFKSGDKQSANFCDEISQVTQRQMITSIFQAFGLVRRYPSLPLSLSEELGTSLRGQSVLLGMAKEQGRTRKSACW